MCFAKDRLFATLSYLLLSPNIYSVRCRSFEINMLYISITLTAQSLVWNPWYRITKRPLPCDLYCTAFWDFKSQNQIPVTNPRVKPQNQMPTSNYRIKPNVQIQIPESNQGVKSQSQTKESNPRVNSQESNQTFKSHGLNFRVISESNHGVKSQSHRSNYRVSSRNQFTESSLQSNNTHYERRLAS